MSDDSSDLSGGEEELPPEASTVDSIVEQVVTLVIAVAIALLIRQVLIEPFRIPSGSMYPTLLTGDHLFVNKLSYGPRIPFTDLRLPGLGEPERGDIVVFEVARPMQRGKPDTMAVDRAPAGSRSEDFVKRLVGLPGDEISWRHGQVFVNGEPLAMARVPEGWTDSASGMHFDRSQEDLGACRHSVLYHPDPRRGALKRGGPIIVEPGRYFMMGDNRDNSKDSREWGTVRLEELKGPAFILYWSWDVNGNMLSFFNPVNWITAEKRWDRVFKDLGCDPVSGATAG